MSEDSEDILRATSGRYVDAPAEHPKGCIGTLFVELPSAQSCPFTLLKTKLAVYSTVIE